MGEDDFSGHTAEDEGGHGETGKHEKEDDDWRRKDLWGGGGGVEDSGTDGEAVDGPWGVH